MRIEQTDLDRAAAEGLVSPAQAQALWAALAARYPTRQGFTLPNVAYYLGALIVIGAMGWFMTEAWERFGGGGIFLIAVAYATGFVLAGRALWNAGRRIPGGLLVTMAVCMTPLAIYGIERWTGVWPQADPGPYTDFHPLVNGSWLLMEAATIAAGLLALRFVRFPFLTAPIAYALWFMSMDLTPLLVGRTEFSWDERLWVSLWFGLAMLVFAWLLDRLKAADYAFWGYLFGLLAFWGGLSSMESGGELGRLAYGLVNVGLVGLSVVLDRRAFSVFGGVGIFGYLAHLAGVVFKDSLLFPFALAAIGLAIIGLALWFEGWRPRKSGGAWRSADAA